MIDQPGQGKPSLGVRLSAAKVVAPLQLTKKVNVSETQHRMVGFA